MDRPYGLLMPTVPDPDLVPFDPPDHPTFRAVFRNIIERYPRALYDEEGLVRYRTRFLDSVLVSEPELIHDSGKRRHRGRIEEPTGYRRRVPTTWRVMNVARRIIPNTPMDRVRR
jgi:hypothetical protein